MFSSLRTAINESLIQTHNDLEIIRIAIMMTIMTTVIHYIEILTDQIFRGFIMRGRD